MRRGVAVLAAAALALAGARAVPAQEPVPEVRVSLKASATEVDWGSASERRVRLTGRLRGPVVAGVRVRLVGRSEDFGRDVVVQRSATDRRGRFAFEVVPVVNGVYDVTVEPGQAVEGRSSQQTVRVFPDVRLRQRVDAGHLVLDVTVTGPAAYRFADGSREAVRTGSSRRASFYVRARGSDTFERIARKRLRTRCGERRCRRTARHTIRSPSLLARAERVLACVPGRPFAGLGEPLRCPRELEG